MAEHRHARRRNILVFVVGVLFLANLFGFYFHATDALGGLGFIVSPILLALALRAFAGDGWADAGFGLRACGNIDVYGIAILLFPALMVGAIGLGVVTGGITILPGAGVALIATMATSLSLIFLFAFFEEAGWRGYLEPRLGAPAVPTPRRHFFVALDWAPWHVGFFLSHPEDYGHLPLPLLLVLTFVAIAAMAVIYGAARTVTASIWPAVIAHTYDGQSAGLVNKGLSYHRSRYTANLCGADRQPIGTCWAPDREDQRIVSLATPANCCCRDVRCHCPLSIVIGILRRQGPFYRLRYLREDQH